MNIFFADQMYYLFIEQLLNKDQADLIAIEVPIISNKRRVDMLSIEGNDLVGYEFKSSRDNLYKLEGQLEDYLKVFNKVYAVLDSKFEKKISNIPENVGIIIFDSGIFKPYREAKANKADSFYQSLFIPKKRLINSANKHIKDIVELRREIIRSINRDDFNKLVLDCIAKRYLDNFNLFKKNFSNNDRSMQDLFLLSSYAKISLDLNKR